MLYDLYEARRTALAPVSLVAGHGAHAFSRAPLAKLPLARAARAGYELCHRLTKDYAKPPFGLDATEVRGERVAVVERVVLERPFCRLVRFERAPEANDPRVLVVAPLSGHHASLLRDTVRQLLPEHEVYVTDWIDAREVPLARGSFGLDDYVAFVEELLRLLGPEVHVLAVCQPSVPVLGAVALMAAAGDARLPRTMTLMGGPIDARLSPTEVNRHAQKHPLAWFERHVIATVPERYPGYLRRVYPGFLQLGAFAAMNPGKHWQSHARFWRDVSRGDDAAADAHRRFYDDYNAVIDMTAEFYLDTVSTVFQRHALPRGAWTVRGARVAPEAIRDVALLTVEGELDDVVGAGQTRAAHELCSGVPASRREHLTVSGAGHYGIFSGRRWRDEVCPRFARFIRGGGGER